MSEQVGHRFKTLAIELYREYLLWPHRLQVVPTLYHLDPQHSMYKVASRRRADQVNAGSQVARLARKKFSVLG